MRKDQRKDETTIIRYLEIQEKVLGKEHKRIAEIYEILGYAYSSEGNHKKAIHYLEKLLAIEEKIPGKNVKAMRDHLKRLNRKGKGAKLFDT